MRAVLCGFALGACMLQRMSALPGQREWVLWMLATMLCALAAFGLARRLSRLDESGAYTGILRASVLLLSMLAALGAGFEWAALRAHWRLEQVLPVAWEGRDLVVTGRVAGLPTRFARGMRFVFAVEPVGLPVASFPRRLQLSWFQRHGAALPTLVPGQRWTLAVRLKRPHGNGNFRGFDYEGWLLQHDLRATGYVRPAPAPVLKSGLDSMADLAAAGLGAAIDSGRAAVADRIARILGDAPHAGVVIALALGEQHGISAADRQRFVRTGTSHLVAISGLHVGLVASFIGALAGWLWRCGCRCGWPCALWLPVPRVAAFAGVVGAGCFVALAGFGIPAQRAFWMLFVVFVTRASGRPIAVSLVLAWALALVVLVDPWAGVSAGFWLSFGAVAALLLAGDMRSRYGNGWRAALAGLLHTQLAVTFALVPLGALWFSTVPLAGPLANVVAIPWVSFLVVPAVLAGVVLPGIAGAWALHGAHGLIGMLAWYLDFCSGWHGALLRLASPEMPALLLALCGFLWWCAPRGWPLRAAAPLLWLPLVFPSAAAPPRDEFRLTVLDVGQGGAALVETATHRLLFDTGPGYGEGAFNAGESIVLPFLYAHGFDRLDRVVVSHSDADHAGGAAAIFAGVAVTSLRASLPPAHALWRRAREAGAEDVGPCLAGGTWRWDGVTFEMLWPQAAPGADPHGQPEPPNTVSCVLRVSTRHHTALLTGDIEAAQESRLVDAFGAALHADILLAPHHGSRTSSSARFLDAVAPRYTVFQAGYRNRFRHPNTQVLARYRARQSALLRSDRDGAVRFETAGAALRVCTYRAARQRYWMD